MNAFVRILSRTALLAIAVIAAFGAVVAAQNGEEPFKAGIEARDDRRWPVVVERMREAIAQRSTESSAKVGARFGIGGTEYLPHFFLGEALFRSNDCAGAVNSWAASEQQNVIQKAKPDLYKFLLTGYAECEKRGVLPPGKLDPQLNALSDRLKEINAVATNVVALGKKNDDAWRADPSLQAQSERGFAEVQTALRSFESARNSRTQRDIDATGAAIDRARPVFVTVETSLRNVIAGRQSAQGLIRDVADAIVTADGLNEQIASKKVPFTASMTTAHQEGRQALSRARDGLTEGQKTLSQPTLALARTAVTDAQNKFQQLLDQISVIEKEQARRLLNEELTRTIDAFSLLDTAVATLDRFIAERPGALKPEQEAERKTVQALVNRARARFDQARKGDSLATIADATKLGNEARDRLTLLIGTFGPLTLRDRGVHEALEQGARQFFNGEYQQAAASLAAGETAAENVALRLHFHLLRAAALYELFLRSPNRDQGLQAQAAQEVQHAKGIDSAFQPDGRAFSPKFMAFYQSVGMPPAAPPAAPQP